MREKLSRELLSINNEGMDETSFFVSNEVSVTISMFRELLSA